MRAGLWLLALAAAAWCGERWEIRFFHDEDDSRLVLNDLAFLSEERGVACGALVERSRERGALVTSFDGGRTWSLGWAPEACLSLCAVGKAGLWMVAPRAAYRSEDGGRTWKRVPAPEGILRVYFRDEERGWAVGRRKGVYETSDGGKTWQRVGSAEQVRANPDHTCFRWIAFADRQHGMIVGGYQGPRRQEGEPIPEWLDPRMGERQRERPGLGIVLETRDGGQNWEASVTTMFGQITRVRFSPSGRALAVVEFERSFEWPSEVFLLDWRTGGSERIFRRADLAITDVVIAGDGRGYLAGVEPVGRKVRLPVAGKVRVLQSENLRDWREAEVDYRAFGRRAMLAESGSGRLWLATDAGMILERVEE